MLLKCRISRFCNQDLNEAREVLTESPAGEIKEDGTRPEGSINYLVDQRLKETSKKLKADDKGEEKKEKMEENNEEASKNLHLFHPMPR